jgi:hypothetical protein
MAGIDLGKQVGPLPLGAWVAVVGAGLGVALYTRRQSAASAEPTVVEDTSGIPGVGTGVNGMWTDVTPVPPTDAPTVYTDNDSWGRAAIDRLVADGYPSAQVYSAITKALAGGTGDNALSVSEFAIWARALVLLKTPPTPVGVPAPSPTGPPGTTTPPAATPKTVEKVSFTRMGRVGIPIPLRAYIALRSVGSGAGPNAIETYLRNTVNDPRNAAYRKGYSGTGIYPGGAAAYVHYGVKG